MVCVLATLLICGRARAQDGLPDAQTSVDAARQVWTWVREWRVEGEPTPVKGACVTLRLDGKMIGRAESLDGSPNVLADVTRTAMLRAQTSLPSDWDVRSEAARRRLMICVELPGTLVPLDGASDAELTLGVSPGLDGVAVRLGQRVAARFALQMLPARESSAGAIRSLVSELADDPSRGLAEIAELRELGYTFYRYRTIQLAQIDPRSTPVFLHRGGRVVEPGELSMAHLHALADGMAAHLLKRRWPGAEAFGFMGLMDPVTGRVESRAEHPGGQALTVSSLARYTHTPGSDAQTVSEVEEALGELIDELAKVEHDEIDPWSDAGAAAATLIALDDASGFYHADGEAVLELRGRCRDTVLSALDDSRKSFGPEVDQGAWGVLSLALVRLARADDPDVSMTVADAVVRSVFRETPSTRLVSHFPWLGWAEMELAADSGPIKAAAALLEARRLIDEHQLDVTVLSPDDRDLAGAVVYTSGGSLLPNWNSIRPLPLLADMLGDERLTRGTITEGEAAAELNHLLGLIRFTNQLAAEAADGHMYARPDRAMWGVRMALWDPRMPLESTALALDGVCRSLDAIDSLAARGKELGEAENKPE